MKKFLLFALLAAVLIAPAHGAPPLTREEIARAIEDLAAAEFQTREAATERLWQAGEAAEAALSLAAKSPDPEVSLRAGIVLQKVRLGIRPDTPTDAIAHIEQYRQLRSTAERQNVLQALQQKGQWHAVAALLRSEQDSQQRLVLAANIAGTAATAAGSLIERGELSEAEKVLDIAASIEQGLPQFTAFVVHTGGLDKHIAAVQDRIAIGAREGDWTRLAYLLRAKGDQAGAIDAADKSSNLPLRMKLRVEARRWSEAAAIAEQLFQKEPQRLEFVGQAATFYGLAGDKQEQEHKLQTLAKAISPTLTPPEPANKLAGPAASAAVNNLLIAAKTLLLNERIDEGLAIMRQINPLASHRILWRQHRHREALAYVSVTEGRILDRAWLDEFPRPLSLLPVRADYRFLMAAQVARQLHELGRQEQVEQIWQLLQDLDFPRGLKIVPAERARRLSLLALLAWQLGRQEDAARVAADAIAAGATPASVLNLLAGREGPLALAWYERALAQNPPVELPEAITTAIRLVKPSPRRGGPPENWRELIAAGRSSLQTLPPPAKAARLVAFGHICKLRGDLKLAQELFQEAADANPATSGHLGDLAAAAGNWDQAAKHYAAASRANPADHTAGYLLGHALSLSGDSEGGGKQTLLANLRAVTPEARLALAKSFTAAHLKAEALRQYDVLCLTALPDSPPATSAAQEIGNIVSTDEPRRSAQCWEQLLVHMLSASFNFNEPEAYLALPHTIHKVLARAVLAEGQSEIAAAELAHCEKYFPADVRTTVDFVPLLRAAGMDDHASDMLERALRAHRQVLEEFPASATYLNNAAWICARSQRKLDEALASALRAIELRQGEAAYHDTLAEVHFQLGDREAALAAAQKCLALAPDNTLYATRLKHFQNAPLKTLDKIDPR